MTPSRWDRLKAIFAAALPLNPDEQAAYLDRECAGDAELRREAVELLAASGKPPATETAPLPLSTDMTADEADRLVGTRIGPYKLLELLGEGGFGAVYVAEQEKPVRRRVALKIIKLGMDTRQVIARFEAERQALAMMDHPNIARVFDAGATDTGRPWFAMELVRGTPITSYCDSAHLTAAERLALFTDVCFAVQHAHQKGVIHRDIKPSNVLVTLHDGKPVPKVIDFGIAKAVGQQLTDKTVYTMHRQMIGTPAYMAPEQAEMSGLDVDTRADVYSLGVLLYELLTGSPPFTSAELNKAGWEGMQRIIREVEPVKPSTRVNTLAKGSAGVSPAGGVALGSAGVPPLELTISTIAAHRKVEPLKLSALLRGDLDWISMKCLEKDRTRRYATANDLAADVKRHLSGEPIIAAPPSVGYRMRKFVRKHKGPMLAGSAVAAALILGMAGMTWQWRVATAQTREAKLSGAFSEAKLAWMEAHSTVDQDELRRYAPGPFGEAMNKAAEAEREAAAGRNERATALYQEAAEGLPIIVKTAVENKLRKQVDAGVAKLEQALTDKKKFHAENALDELAELVPNDARLADWRARANALAWPDLGDLEIETVRIEPGSFMMGTSGAAPDDDDDWDYGKPAHMVTISQPFEMGKYEITQEQWMKVMGGNPSHFKGAKRPVENVSWNDCQKFVKRLNEIFPGKTYSLPTEAQWEYACRAGSQTAWCFGDDAAQLGDYAWYSANVGGETHDVGGKKPNDWDLHDMHGNVWEWCEDSYHETYEGAPADGSAWLNGGEQNGRVLRGASWYGDSTDCRSAVRVGDSPGRRNNDNGFRVVVVVASGTP